MLYIGLSSLLFISIMQLDLILLQGSHVGINWSVDSTVAAIWRAQMLNSLPARRHYVIVTASISPSIQDVQELHALSPPSAGRYALALIHAHVYIICVIGNLLAGARLWLPHEFTRVAGPVFKSLAEWVECSRDNTIRVSSRIISLGGGGSSEAIEPRPYNYYSPAFSYV